MYFPVSDILNDTIFGIPKEETSDWSSAINAIIIDTDKESKT